jgi:gamma-glutamyl-gamma-aminobutyrate hydrolase PuuD
MSNNKEKPKIETDRYKCYVVGGGFDYLRLMYQLGCDGAKGLDDADFVLFTGGEDVDPQLYGEVAMAKTYYNSLRDAKEATIYRAALDREIPMVGICRGGQFLNVMNEGKMWQHVNNHTTPHIMRIEIPPFHKGNKRRTIMVTSTHHQMMIPSDHAVVVGVSYEAFEKHAPGLSKLGCKHDDPDHEVLFYDGTNCLCFQPHPEMKAAKPELVDFFEECLEAFTYPHIPVKPKNEMEKVIIGQIPTTKKGQK